MASEQIASYVLRYGGRCRDCGDEDGICPTNGMPCEPEVKRAVINHTLKALEYGISHGFIADPFTRPAPATTDTGLVTVGTITEECLLELKQMLCGEIHPCNDIGDVTDADIELVTRSQAEELLAAERARYAEASQRATNEESLKDTMHRGLLRWKERAEKSEADNTCLIRHGEALKADNAAKDAAYKRLEQQAIKDRKLRDEAQSDADLWRFSVDMGDHPSLLVKVWKQRKALEAKLAAANEVAQLVIQAEEDKSGDPNFYILMMQTAYDKARAVLGGKPS